MSPPISSPPPPPPPLHASGDGGVRIINNDMNRHAIFQGVVVAENNNNANPVVEVDLQNIRGDADVFVLPQPRFFGASLDEHPNDSNDVLQ